MQKVLAITMIVKNTKNIPVYALDFKSYSSQFYTKGKIKIVDTITLHNLILNKDDFNILIDHSRLKLLSTKLQESLTPIESNKKRAMYVQKNK